MTLFAIFHISRQPKFFPQMIICAERIGIRNNVKFSMGAQQAIRLAKHYAHEGYSYGK